MSVKRKRVVVSLETKLEAIKRVDKGETMKKVAKELGVGEVTVGDWVRNRRNIEEWCSHRFTDNKRKTMRKGDYEQTSEALFRWFTEAKLKGTPLSGPIIQAKALELHKPSSDRSDIFTASVGWLERWKKRYGITHFNSPAEERHALSRQRQVSNAKDKNDSSLNDVFYWNDNHQDYESTPIKMETVQEDDDVAVFDDSNNELTRVNYSDYVDCHEQANSCSGITTVEEPLEQNHAESISFNNTNQLHAWMDSCLFKKYFDDLVSNRRKKDRNDQYSSMLNVVHSYPLKTELQSDFLTGNHSFDLPHHQDVNRNYRKLILKQILEDLENDRSVFSSLERINEKGVLYWLKESWKEVRTLTTFKSRENESIEYNNDSEDEALISSVGNPQVPFPVTAEDIQHWMKEDEETKEKYFSAVDDGQVKIKQEVEDESDQYMERSKISHSEGVDAIETVLLYAEQQGDYTPEEVNLLKKIKRRAEMKQTMEFNEGTFTES